MLTVYWLSILINSATFVTFAITFL